MVFYIRANDLKEKEESMNNLLNEICAYSKKLNENVKEKVELEKTILALSKKLSILRKEIDEKKLIVDNCTLILKDLNLKKENLMDIVGNSIGVEPIIVDEERNNTISNELC
jgi:predicted RNase H-like nuclease (RuvC/YqgF family)